MDQTAKHLTLFFANAQQSEDGEMLRDLPAEQIIINWDQLGNKKIISLSTGEALEVDVSKEDGNLIRITNMSYFGSGRYGRLLGALYTFIDGSESWVVSVKSKSKSSQNLNMLIGNWFYGLPFDKLSESEHWTGSPYIGYTKDFVEIQMGRVETICDIQLTPNTYTIRPGEKAIFSAMHPYSEKGNWIYDKKLTVIEETNKSLVVTSNIESETAYDISYSVHKCMKTSKLFIQTIKDKDKFKDPKEPIVPPLMDKPATIDEPPKDIVDLMNPAIPMSPLYKYPNIMKRNARYRGHRESEKALHDHQEQIYDIRQLHRSITDLKKKADLGIQSWFEGKKNISISMKIEENVENISEIQNMQNNIHNGHIRTLGDNMIQLNRDSSVNGMLGIYELKQHLQQLDERVAEAERRYQSYENAYE